MYFYAPRRSVCLFMVVVCGWVYWVIEITEVHCAGLCVYDGGPLCRSVCLFMVVGGGFIG